MSDYARRERAALADLLVEVGPDEPTLCNGWSTSDLAAHLVVRERRPDAALGMLIPPLAGHGDRVRRAKAAKPYAEVVDEVRRPPWWSWVSNPVTDELTNALEFFVHHEDVRRARPDWTPRVLDTGEQKAIWGVVRFVAPLGLRKAHVPVRLRAPGFGEISVGGDEPLATLIGEPGELALFVSGRQRHARVEIDGPAEVAGRLRTADLSL